VCESGCGSKALNDGEPKVSLHKQKKREEKEREERLGWEGARPTGEGKKTKNKRGGGGGKRV